MSQNWESSLLTSGYQCVAGIDEVGMGCLAGPVIAAAVILNPQNIPAGITDSKLLSPKKRENLKILIEQSAIDFAVGQASVEEIDTLNIYHAARLAMKRAVEKLSLRPDFLLVDGRAKIDLDISQQAIVQGDKHCVSIGAASIVAKVFRDKMMTEFDLQYPGYAFAKHKGYGSVVHRTCLQEKGPCPIHRKSFSWTPV
ncbi:MAG: ribonuclease HII [Proteobacteria bacterium]|nr:ribonuclease HII [Pseudomonadota bacterium]NDG25904.1 ribonuclease HII [Pseudomonadota bacterium]